MLLHTAMIHMSVPTLFEYDYWYVSQNITLIISVSAVIVTMYTMVDSQTKFVHNVKSHLCSICVPNLHAMLLWFIRHQHHTKSYIAELLPRPCQSYFTCYKNITTKKSCTFAETLLGYFISGTYSKWPHCYFCLTNQHISHIIIIIINLLSQAFPSWLFSWTSSDPHRSGFKLHTAVLSVLCVLFQV
jgi:hypothetical protein